MEGSICGKLDDEVAFCDVQQVVQADASLRQQLVLLLWRGLETLAAAQGTAENSSSASGGSRAGNLSGCSALSKNT